MKSRILFAAVVSLAALGCPSFVKASGPPFTPASVPQGKAVVYFYRPAAKIMSDYPFGLSIPESANNCFFVRSGGYWAQPVDPGPLKVAGMMLTYRTLSLDIKPGEERYVEIQVVDDDGVMVEVPAAEAKPKIAQTLLGEVCHDKIKK